jgi:hypothetical protein
MPSWWVNDNHCAMADRSARAACCTRFFTTYRSFWGQFGWMSTPMPDREYVILGVVSLVALMGWIWWLIERRRAATRWAIGPPTQSVGHGQGGGMPKALHLSPAAAMLVLWFVLTVGGYLYYNVTFVQHQGRYLFPAMIPIGLAFAIGWWQILDKIKQALARFASGSTHDWTPWLNQAQLIVFALVFVYLARLDLVALQRYIIPNLSA